MRHVVQCLQEYQGVDIVPDLIRRNQFAYGSQTVRFTCLDLTVDTLPRCDLVLCRDCFIHLPTRAIRQAIGNFIASGATWLLAGNQPGALYHDIPLGSFRPVDLTAPPFSWPEPLERLADNDGELCLWRLQDLDEVHYTGVQANLRAATNAHTCHARSKRHHTMSSAQVGNDAIKRAATAPTIGSRYRSSVQVG